MELLLIFVAPVLQIVLSLLRLKRKIILPIGAIAVLAIIAGYLLSIQAGKLLMDGIVADSPKGSVHCGMPFAACFILGTFVDTIAAIVIGAICAIIYYRSNKTTSLA
jgi:hypothetical protein